MKTLFGQHLFIEGYVFDPNKLTGENISSLIDTVVDGLRMKYLQPPMAFNVKLDLEKLETENDEGGVSVFAQITTSHIAFHAWPLRCAFFADIFSCKLFDIEMAKQAVLQGLGVKKYHSRVIYRGDRNISEE